MKQLSTIYQALLGLAVIILFFLHFSGNSSSEANQDAGQTPDSDTLASSLPEAGTEEEVKPKSSVSMAYVNTDSLLLQYEYYIKIEKQLANRRRAMEADVQNRQNQLQDEVIQFQQSLQTGSITEEIARQTQEGLMKKEQNLLEYSQGLEKTYVEEETKMNKELNRRVKEFVAKFSDENGYDFIFGYSLSTVAQGVLHGNVAYDVTQEIIKGLNTSYQAEQNNQ